MATIRIGIIGVGNMGTAHANCIYSGQVEELKLTALCDNNEERLQFSREKFGGLEYFSNWEDMLDSTFIDAVLIAVPHRLHSIMAEAALKKGIHVLVEKPVDVSVSCAARLNETAQKSGKVFSMMFNQRTNSLFAKAREIVKSGQLGEIKRSVWIVTNWYRTQSYYNSGDWRATWDGEGGGVLLNQAPHNLDLWQWICGMPQTITAFCDNGKYHDIEVEDDVTIFARYPNGATGAFITTTGEYPGTNRLEISGSLGKIVLEGGVLKWWKLSMSEREYCFDSENNQLKTEYTEITETEETAHKGILQNFTNAILYGEELLAPGVEGINELTISNAAYLSAWKGNIPVSIPFDSTEFDILLEEHKTKHTDKAVKRDTEVNGYLPRWQVTW